MSLVNSIFDGKGYPGWRRSVLIALSAKKKLGFINGTYKIPDLLTADHEKWVCCNDMVTSWLLNSLTKEIGDSVIYSKTAKELWDSLEHRFGKSNGAKLYHLQKEISGLVQGNSDVAGYFTKLKRLWDELDSLNLNICCTCECKCEGKSKLAKSLHDQRLIQFLMGLNDVYAQARGNILMMNPLPNIDHAYSLLLQDENHREVYVSANVNYTSDSVAFMATSQGRTHPKPGNQSFRGPAVTQQKFGGNTQRNGKGFQKNKPRKSKYNPNVSCTHCGKIGHVEADCYRLIGYPDDFEFTKSRSYSTKANAEVETEEAEISGIIQADAGNIGYNQFMSKDQYNSLVQQVIKDAKLTHAGTFNGGISANAIAGPFNEEHSSFW